MRPLSDTLARLSRLKAAGLAGLAPGPTRLSPMTEFGPNPGGLLAHRFIPAGLAAHAPLVVVLHGCTQTAGDYDRCAGWSTLADAHGFALLFPEQQRQNNANTCFNWFEPGDTKRGQGEPHSIRQMIERVCVTHRIDRRRIYITGLSAGGAMAGTMLATYPEVFAGGAIIAGLPFASATSVSEAFSRMRGHGFPSDDQMADAVLGASDWRGPWPVVSVWHGDADAMVSHANADAIAAQWCGVQRIPRSARLSEASAGRRRVYWHGADGRLAVEIQHIVGMSHGTPIASGLGEAGPYFLDVDISSTREIATRWGLTGGSRSMAAAQALRPAQRPAAAAARAGDIRAPGRLGQVKAVIEDALRGAGLMR